MSTAPVPDPLQQQQPPPMVMAQQAAYTAHSGRGSIGPFIGVLAVITVLCAIAVMIGRLCSGRRVVGYGTYDFQRWVETKCGSCIDGHVSPPPPQRVAESSSTASAGSNDTRHSVVQEEAPPKTKQDEASNQQHRQHGRAEP